MTEPTKEKLESPRRGYQTSDFADGLPKVKPNQQGGGNDSLDEFPGCGGFDGTSGYQSGPSANGEELPEAAKPKPDKPQSP